MNSLFRFRLIIAVGSASYLTSDRVEASGMMNSSIVELIERRFSASLFDAGYRLADTQIEELTRLATRAPTAYNLQNWRFIAVRSPEAKARLRDVAFGQAKVVDAAVTFIICGVLPDHAALPARLEPSVAAGYMPAAMAAGWQESVRTKYAHPQTARDEALRSATLGAATLMLAAEASGLVSGPMIGFDAKGVAREFGLAPNEIPAMLVAIGRAAPGNWPQ